MTAEEQYDRQLLLQLQQNDEQVWPLLMKRHYRNMYHYGCRFTTDEELVKDAIQEVLLRLWERKENAKTIHSLHYYLVVAVKNQVLTALRRTSRYRHMDVWQEEAYPFEVSFSIEKIIIDRQLSEGEAKKLEKLLNHLSPRQKEVIYLKYYQHLTHHQIASLMHISQQSLYNLLHESIRKLRSSWQLEYGLQQLPLSLLLACLLK